MILIGTAGHVNHGKTTLVRALTGVECDRLSEEKARGITIELGFASWELPNGRHMSIVDVPGHAKFVHTMATGAHGIEGVLLLVAADEGCMPQTYEHLSVCQLYGIRQGVVAVTRTDRVDDVDGAVDRIRAQLEPSILAMAPLVPVCAPRGEGIDALTEAVIRMASEAKPSHADKLSLLLPVDRSFSKRGFGTVVTGSLVRGRVRVGDEVQLTPGDARCRVRGLQIHNGEVEEAQAPCRLAMNVSGVEPDRVQRGDLITEPQGAYVGDTFDAEVTWLHHVAGPATSKMSLGYVCAGHRAVGRVRPDGTLSPGETKTARVYLDRELPLVGGMRFVLRGPGDPNYGSIVGGGRILDAHPPRRRKASVRAALGGGEGTRALLEEAGPAGIVTAELAPRLGVPPTHGPARLFAPDALTRAAGELVAAVRAWQSQEGAGMPAARAATLGAAHVEALPQTLADGLLLQERSTLLTPDFANRGDAEAEKVADAVLGAIRDAGFNAHREKELGELLQLDPKVLRRTLQALEKRGDALRVTEFCFPGEGLRSLQTDAADAVLSGESLSVGWLKDRTGASRKHAMPLWAWLDKTGVTRRRGNVRVAGPKAAAFSSLGAK